MKYEILEDEIRCTLVDEVNEYIKDGWRPIGGATLTAPVSYNGTYTYIQAMIKE